jgi:CheY-like chemotaxis protein
MRRLLLVEDHTKELLSAAAVAESLGFGDVDACQSVHKAMRSLEKGMSGEGPLPDAIVLDLDLGVESGYELLRYWRGTPALSRIPVMIWSVVEEQRDVCELFRVKSFVSKWEGMGAFRKALSELIPSVLAG